MISDCYFFLGYVNKENFIKIKNTLSRNEDLIHVLKTAFDVEADLELLKQHSDLIKESCNSILEAMSQ